MIRPGFKENQIEEYHSMKRVLRNFVKFRKKMRERESNRKELVES